MRDILALMLIALLVSLLISPEDTGRKARHIHDHFVAGWESP